MLRNRLALAALGLALVAGPALAATTQEEPRDIHWSYEGPFGKFDKAQLQRGYKVYREVCSACHSMEQMSFRNLGQKGGPFFDPRYPNPNNNPVVKSLAHDIQIKDLDQDTGDQISRPGLPSDKFPNPFANAIAAAASNGGAAPPDLSVMAKARSVEDKFPNWLFNYSTTYAEGGPDYIHALLNGYVEPPPAGVEIPDGKHYNKVFPGHAIGMPPPLADGQVPYGKAEDGSTVPLTVDQYSRDVAAFLMWVAEPHLNETKAAGFRILTFLLLFAVLMWLVKQRVWRKVEH